MSRIWRWWLGWVERHIVADDPWDEADRQRAAVARHPSMRARWADMCPVCAAVIRRGPVDEHVCEAVAR